MPSNFPFLTLGGPQGTDVYGREDGFLSAKYYNVSGGAVAIGDVLMVDHGCSDASTTTFDNTSTSAMGAVAAPTAGYVAGTDLGMSAVVTDLLDGAGADDTAVQCCIFGEVDAYVIRATGSVAVGDVLVVTTAKNFDGVTASGEPVRAQAREAVTTPTTRALGLVHVDNWFTMTAGVTG